MTVDIEKLEALAKAAKSGGAEWSDLNVDTERMYTAEGMLVELYEFATPAVLLQLIARKALAEEARDLYLADKKRLLDKLNDSRAEVAGLKTGYEAYERMNAELTQRIANLELCQTASLGVSGIIKSAASELGFDAAGEDSALDYLIELARKAGALRAECEALRKDKDRLDALEGNFWDVRHSSEALADTGDYTSGVEVIGHWMDKPFERVIGENYTESLRAAIDQAMTADAYPPARPDYSELDAAMDSEATQ
ncbi:hypothetical protein [Pseudomonas syringae]|uniref:hypothetical protein n=1 Tax=Pseudomonas syringae TaxID=317 RepID=UPI000A266A1A|nr:hypothetical protein [Pseudomonas syringae]OSN39540.1 hypothetical protein BV342_01251 [Pseudomonas syringae pv. actinidiae]OSR62613.1 hypothetical protein BV325_01651 [Pseudomonas syringae pv. actinidiae]OSR79940.1 hypothetical protein BV328_01637 [Pseudomonas syringae pv. actinidiae]